jgi:xanthine dehydrogenase accessory factor
VLVFTHDAKLDVPALIAAFATDAGYIGALGSRQTTADREVRLRESGATDADLERMYAPCGLDVGAATVEETAIAVLAEMTAHRAQRSGASLRDSSGPIRRRRPGAPELAAPMPVDHERAR